MKQTVKGMNNCLRVGIKIALNLLLRQEKYENARPQEERLLENDADLKFKYHFSYAD